MAAQSPSPSYKSYTIDLDLPARNRWAHVVQDNLEPLEDLVQAYNHALVEEFGFLAPVANAFAGMVSVPTVFKEEMLGLSEASGGRLSYSLIMRLNIGYDFVAKCTSAGVKVHDTMYALRNMDWDMPVLKKLTLLVRFTRKGKTVHQGITWLGFVGCYTALSNQGYSVALNYRKVGSSDLVHISGALLRRRQSLGFVVRLLLEQELSMEEFVKRLSTAPLIAPCYLTVVGTERAVVLTRGKIALEECRTMEKCPGGAYVIQTNHDPWRTKAGNPHHLSDKAWPAWAAGDELLLDTRERYECALKGIKDVIAQVCGPGAGAEALTGAAQGPDAEHVVSRLSSVMQAPPVKNRQTVYGVVMIPSQQRMVVIN